MYETQATKTDWIVFSMAVVLVILSYDGITKYIGSWWCVFCCSAALVCCFYFVMRLFFLWQKEMKS